MAEFTAWEDMSERDQLATYWWDAYKDAYNSRPRGVDTSSWTVEDFQTQLDLLSDVIASNVAADQIQEQEAIQAFERSVAHLQTMGAKDRADALRWIMDSTTCNGDWDALCFEFGLPFAYFNQTKQEVA